MRVIDGAFEAPVSWTRGASAGVLAVKLAWHEFFTFVPRLVAPASILLDLQIAERNTHPISFQSPLRSKWEASHVMSTG